MLGLSLGDVYDTGVSAGNVEEIVPAGLIFKGPLEPVLAVGSAGVMENVELAMPVVTPEDVSGGVEASMRENMVLLCVSGLSPLVTVATVRRGGLSGCHTWQSLQGHTDSMHEI